MKELLDILDESTNLYNHLFELEQQKYESLLKNDLVKLDEVVAKEQVAYLKMRGLEQKREKLVTSLGFKDKTLKEIIELITDNEYKSKLTEKYKELNKLILDIKNTNSLCKTLIEARLQGIENKDRRNKCLDQLF